MMKKITKLNGERCVIIFKRGIRYLVPLYQGVLH
jgi:hypothetical protein